MCSFTCNLTIRAHLASSFLTAEDGVITRSDPIRPPNPVPSPKTIRKEPGTSATLLALSINPHVSKSNEEKLIMRAN